MHNADTAPGRVARNTLLLGDPLVLRPVRLADRLLARALGASLDQQLAAGWSPESSRLLAAPPPHVGGPELGPPAAGGPSCPDPPHPGDPAQRQRDPRGRARDPGADGTP